MDTCRNSCSRPLASLLMIAALFWLTVSPPYVNEASIQLPAMEQDGSPSTGEEGNPYQGNSEEKNESSSNGATEYLHSQHESEELLNRQVNMNKYHSDGIYLAFHPELVGPPPKAYCL